MNNRQGNRRLIAEQMKFGDLLVWHVNRKPGVTWKCMWYKTIGGLTFIAVENNKVRVLFRIGLK